MARQTAGVHESAALPGGYWATVFLGAGWAGLAVWDVTGRYGVQAFEEFGPEVLPALLPPYTGPAARPDLGHERPGAPRGPSAVWRQRTF